MMSPAPVPDELLWSGSEGPPQEIHGDLPAAQLDRIIALDSGTDRQENGTREDTLESEQAAAELDYLAGLHTPSGAADEPAHKVRVLMVEIGSSGSTDMPRRTLRVPLDAQGRANLAIAIRMEEEEDQDGIETQPVPVREAGPPLHGFLGSMEGGANSAGDGGVESDPDVEPGAEAMPPMTQENASTGPADEGS